MQRPNAALSAIRGLCAVVGLTAGALSPPVQAQNYLKPAALPIGNSFDAALRNEAPMTHSGRDRYLHQDNRQTQPDVVFADEGSTLAPGLLFGHSQPVDQRPIEQTQYPLDNPPAAAAPDEPGRLATAPPLIPQQDPQPWISSGDFNTEVTSVLGSGDDLGITSVVVRGVIESPRRPGFSIRPVFGLHAIAGPTTTDLPGQLYDVSVEARMYLPFGDRWLGEFAIAPGIFSDFENTSGDAFRIVGRGIGYYKCSETVRLAVGLAYLDRQDIALLPLGGVIWTPNPDWRYEIMLPRPRIAHRYQANGDDERWVYVLGEFGGGSWAIERASGAADIATIRDYRLLFGIERQHETGMSYRLEAGYVFGRELEYNSGPGSYQPDGTGVVRAALTF